MNRLTSFGRLHLLVKKNQPSFIKDPLYGSINFSEDQLWLYELINSEEFQRLNKLKQMYWAFLNFPAAVHTRLSHSLGVYELCNRFIKGFLERNYLDKEKDREAINIALASALLHDVGHGPLSHAFEHAVHGFDHELMGSRIIQSPESKIYQILRKKSLEDGKDEGFYSREIAKVLNKTSQYSWVVSLISSDLDVDRLDYLARDSMYSGVSYGKNIDIDLFIKWAVIKNGQLAFLSKIMHGLEHFMLSRKHMYEDLYGNRVNNTYEHLFIKACDFIRENIDKCSEAVNYDMCGFVFKLPSDSWKIEDFVALYDDILISFVKSALLKNFENENVRELLGHLFGVWLDENGCSIQCPANSKFENVLDEATWSRQLKKKGDLNVSINMWDPEQEKMSVTSLLIILSNKKE